MGFLGKKTVIPGPSGPHAVGTTRVDLTEPGYFDPFTPGALRRVPVALWYPAQASERAREPAIDEAVRAALSELTRVPKFLLRPGESFSVRDATPVAGRFPVLLFNHGFGSFQKQSASLMQELASHGYVVLSVGHPFESLVVEHMDGTVVRWRSDLPAWKAVSAGLADLEKSAQEAAPIIRRAREAKNSGALKQAMSELSTLPSYAALLPVLESWTRDTQVVLGQLPLRELIDAEKIGVFGHSLGGILAGQLAMTDSRVRAGMNFDGAQLPPPAGDYALKAPFCFVYADTATLGRTKITDEGMNDALAVEGPPGSCGACLSGAGHLNFTDMNNRASMASALGTIDRGEMARRLRALTVGFFDHHLKGKPLSGFGQDALLRVHWPKGNEC